MPFYYHFVRPGICLGEIEKAAGIRFDINKRLEVSTCIDSTLGFDVSRLILRPSKSTADCIVPSR